MEAKAKKRRKKIEVEYYNNKNTLHTTLNLCDNKFFCCCI